MLRPEGKSERAVIVIDREGILRSVEVYPQDQQPENEDTWKVLEKLEPDAPPALVVKSTPPPVAIPQGGIIMYCTPWCADCRRARKWFQEQGIKITEVNVIQNPEADARVKAWGNGYRITPTFDIDGIIIVDFKLDKIREALKARDLA
jgi:glutaredoxin